MFLSLFFAFVLFIVLDAVFWRFNIRLIETQVIDIQRVALQIKPLGAILAYLVIICGFYWFILKDHRPVLDAAILGGFVNGVYEFTNYSIFKKWNLKMVVADTLWGAFLWGFVTYMTYTFDKYISTIQKHKKI